MTLRLDFSPFRNHYFFLVTTILAALGWLLAFIFQAIATAQFGHRAVGSLWFAILHQGALNVGVIAAIATDSIETARLQLAAFGSIAIVFAVLGADLGVFSLEAALQAMGAGYLVLALVNIVWVLYFTSEPESLALHVLDRLGVAPPAPHRRRRSRASVATALTTSSKPNYKLGGGIGSPEMGVHEPKRNSVARSVISTIRRPPSVMSLKRTGTGRSTGSRKSLVGSIAGASDSESEPRRPPVEVVPPMPTSMPGLPDAPHSAPDTDGDADTEEEIPMRARALHAYKGSPEDPNELSFAKGEVLEIEDQEGKWWQAKKADGTFGIVPSNYLVVIK
ncbi:hypothetical protein B0H19DRAFT_1024994 [Mycena capillaripes]|nr:hypothetical protein B0H19DRAFT_1024994 [Mycena capillaripes]